jgi:hypothetical protein
MKIELLKPFGPQILKSYLSDEMVNIINSYIEKVPIDDYSTKLVGRIEIQSKIDNEFLQIIGFEDLVCEICNNFIKTNYQSLYKDVSLYDAWYNDYKEMDYIPLHFHKASFSGIIYLQVPELEDGTDDGQTHFFYGTHIDFSNSVFKVKPEIGMMLLFPSYLAHLAYPTRIKENRRTMSFNLI